ncbi:Secreted acid phosphatase [Streptomyces mirabilis]|uniref:HAD family acid phosphatase n=1 Tax=Streptomyces mirabilis TaxID=68239 RepID=UPI0022C3E7CB|nr:Secreted acid phosphatase [Streptomyces mirabilis]
MRKSLRAAAIAAACAVAGGALYGTGVATAGQSTANSTHEPYNIGLLVKDIDTYYGATLDSNGVYQASKDSQYAKDLSRLELDAKRYIDRAAHKAKHRGEKPAVVFDIDDTLLLSLDYEKKTNYTYNSASWAAYVAQADRPAVFGTPELVAYAESKGVEVFYNSGLKESQRVSAVANLKKVGADINLDADHMFLKDAANPPAYLSACATAAAWNCTTVQYKSGTRRHIESLGYDIVANFGDQYSDLDGGYADKTFKLPNPTYFVG